MKHVVSIPFNIEIRPNNDLESRKRTIKHKAVDSVPAKLHFLGFNIHEGLSINPHRMHIRLIIQIMILATD